MHYSGRRWATQGVPLSLTGVWGVSERDVFAVSGNGVFGDVYHFDGTAWTVMASGATQSLDAVWGSSGSDVYAVGYGGEVLHYDGSLWSTIDLGTTERLHDVWGSAHDDVYIVGNNAIIQHWDGAVWSDVSPGGSWDMMNIWGSAADDVWILNNGASVLHWDGTSWGSVWTGVNTPKSDIWGTAADDIWIVGNSGVLIHYDGAAWSEVASPTMDWLFAVGGVSADNLFAAGTNGIVLHYDGTHWSELRSDTIQTIRGIWANRSAAFFVAPGGPASRLLLPGPPCTRQFERDGDYTACETGAAFEDISATGTLAGTADTGHWYLPIGFHFDLYGQGYTQVAIQADGTLSFTDDTVGPNAAGQCLPFDPGAAQAVIAPLWDDLTSAGGPGQGVWYETRGTAGNRRFIAQWVAEHSPSSPQAALFQVVIHERDREIEYRYLDPNFGDAATDGGASATIGIQAGPGGPSISYSCNQASLQGGQSLTFWRY